MTSTHEDAHAQESQTSQKPHDVGTRMAGADARTATDARPKGKAKTKTQGKTRTDGTAARDIGGAATAKPKRPAGSSRGSTTPRAKRARTTGTTGEGTQEGETMPSGRERNILRWELHAYLLQQQLNQIDEDLAQQQGQPTAPDEDRRARLENARITLQKQLDALGPSPKAKMG